MAGLSLLLALSCGLSQAQPAGPARHLDRLLGDAGLRDLDGRVWTARGLAGRVVLVDVWATWCAPCLAELPTLRRVQAAHGDRVVVLGVSLDTMPRRDFASWLSRRQIAWPQVFDGRGYSSPFATRLEIQAVPVSWLFSADGRLAARDLRGDALERLVRDLVEDAK
jgi:thiol-disulfide isomerase/thioredoxin